MNVYIVAALALGIAVALVVTALILERRAARLARHRWAAALRVLEGSPLPTRRPQDDLEAWRS